MPKLFHCPKIGKPAKVTRLCAGSFLIGGIQSAKRGEGAEIFIKKAKFTHVKENLVGAIFHRSLSDDDIVFEMKWPVAHIKVPIL